MFPVFPYRAFSVSTVVPRCASVKLLRALLRSFVRSRPSWGRGTRIRHPWMIEYRDLMRERLMHRDAVGLFFFFLFFCYIFNDAARRPSYKYSGIKRRAVNHRKWRCSRSAIFRAKYCITKIVFSRANFSLLFWYVYSVTTLEITKSGISIPM